MRARVGSLKYVRACGYVHVPVAVVLCLAIGLHAFSHRVPKWTYRSYEAVEAMGCLHHASRQRRCQTHTRRHAAARMPACGCLETGGGAVSEGSVDAAAGSHARARVVAAAGAPGSGDKISKL